MNGYVVRGLSALVAVAIGATLAATAGCSANHTYDPLPDLATKSPSRQKVLTQAEQKQAIDDMIAKRNAQAASSGDDAAAKK